MNFIKCINENSPFTFAKYGDGEYLCAIRRKGNKCDHTKYTEKLAKAVIDSYIYLAPLENSYLGKWGDDTTVCKFFESIVKPTWVNYSSFIFGTTKEFNEKLDLLKTIKNAKQQKIYVCNESVSKVAPLFNITNTILIHPSDWYEQSYNTVLNRIKDTVINNESIIIMTSAGMGAKALLADLRKMYQNAILIDIGSAFDVFTYKATRSYNMTITKNEVDEWIKRLINI